MVHEDIFVQILAILRKVGLLSSNSVKSKAIFSSNRYSLCRLIQYSKFWDQTYYFTDEFWLAAIQLASLGLGETGGCESAYADETV